ncbi:MAG TPA: carbamoyltransferase C-terminal domain-containing protein, partial [Candidatus Angelobacter sp.]|nr:carbamoyltransferase C-terminal domain-containing protein [Candidatus Angelobacter sp.]
VLGWHGGLHLAGLEDSSSGFAQHDGAAVLLRDGRIVAAIEEERLNRVKHSNFFPARAIRFCLAEAGVTIADVDAIVTDVEENLFNGVALLAALNDPTLPVVPGRERIGGLFKREFGVDVSHKVHFCRHHIAHLHGCWYSSGFPDALAVCLDGEGDGLSGLIASCSESRIEVLRPLAEAHSLGNFYTKMIGQLGFRRFDEYKAMGLAPYGDPTVYDALFQRMYALLPDGQFTILPDEGRWGMLMEAGLLTQARRKDQPFTQQHKDFAAALQAALERIVQHLLEHFHRVTAARRLCLSGGVAHNCTMNGRILRSGRFEQIYIQPAAHDAGNALGAALWLVRNAGQAIPRDIMPNLYLGSDVGSADEIGERLACWSPFVEAKRVPDAPAAAAEIMAGGGVIGWVQGRSEFGPRALGNRSILADPRPAANKDIINAMVKKREGFRPFAPSVLEERLADYFESLGVATVPFMVITLQVRPEMRQLLGAVTHADGSARVQSVSRADNPRYHALIEAFGRLTGVPVVLNTSFNNNAEPIVDSIDDAVACFLTTGINRLFVGDWLVEKAARTPGDVAFLELVPHIPQCRKLVERAPRPGAVSHSIESTVSSFFTESAVAISPVLARLLVDRANGASTRARCRRHGIEDPAQLSQLSAELFDLWQRRSIQLLPAR